MRTTVKRTTKIIIAATAITALGAGVLMAKEKSHFHPKMAFEAMDTNKDQMIESEEFKSFLTKHFDEADSNKDQILEAKEIVEHVKMRRAKKRVHRMMRFVDMNGDEKISRDEMNSRSEKLFALLDINADGKVEKSELPFGRKHHKEDK